MTGQHRTSLTNRGNKLAAFPSLGEDPLYINAAAARIVLAGND